MDPYCLTVHIYKDGKTIKKSTRLHRSQDSSLGRGMASEERDIFSSLAQFPNLVIVPLADVHWASQVIVVKNLSVNAGDVRDARHMGLIPASERFPGGGHGNSLQYFCLENPMNRGDWWATVYGITVRHNWSDTACSTHRCSLKATFSFIALFSICDLFHTHTQSLERRLVVHFLVKPTPDQMPLEGLHS